LIVASGSIIVWKTEQGRIGWILIVLGLAFATWIGVLDVLDATQSWVDAGIGMISLVIYLVLIFPNGRLLSRAARIVMWVAVIGGLVASATGLFASGTTGTESAAEQLSVGFYAVLMLVAASVQIVSFAGRSVTEKKQIKWFLYAVSVSALLYLIASVVGVSEESFLIIDAVATSIWPLGILVAILKYRLYEIDRIVARTLSYTIVVGLLAAAFLGLITLITTFLPTQDSLAVAGATLAAAAVFNPLRKRVQRAVDRRFNRSGFQAAIVTEEFAAKLRESLTASDLIELWSQTVNATFQPSVSAIWLNQKTEDDPSETRARP